MSVSDGMGKRIPDVRTLSARESAVLEMTARGMKNNEIARAMELSVHGVKFHLASVYRKLGVTNRTEAAVVYMRATYGS